MPIIQFAAIGFMVMVTSGFSAERSQRQLPPTPQATAIKAEPKPSMGMQTLKDTSQFMINEFEDACKAHITTIKSFTLDPVKPEGYDSPIYYTQQDKIGLIGNLNSLLKNTTGSVNKKLSDLEAAETTKNAPLSAQDVLKNFREIYGILNEGRKNCSLSLSQIEKQTEKTKALKNCQSPLKKDPPLDSQKKKTGLSHSIKKILPGSRDQKKNQQTGPADVIDREAPTTSKKAKAILGTKETKEEEKERRLREALKKSGLG